MDIKDRGNIKWTSLMLVEHRERLEKLKRKESLKEKPELDEQIYEIFNYRIREALENGFKLKIVYYRNNDYKEIISSLERYDNINKKLILTDNKIKELYLDNIIDIIINN